MVWRHRQTVGYRIFLVITIPATYFFYISIMGLFSDSSNIGYEANWRKYIEYFSPFFTHFRANEKFYFEIIVGIKKKCFSRESNFSFFSNPIFFFSSHVCLLLRRYIFLENRKLLQTSELEQQGNDSYNCTPPAIKEFPPDGFTREQRQAGFVIIHFVIAIYLFLLLAIVCDDYFVPSIKKICEREYITEGLLSRLHHIFTYPVVFYINIIIFCVWLCFSLSL